MVALAQRNLEGLSANGKLIKTSRHGCVETEQSRRKAVDSVYVGTMEADKGG